jgi:hypothetical protein
MLKQRLSVSRLKIRAHHNELKELDTLVKKRNVIRVLRVREEKENVVRKERSQKKEIGRRNEGEKVFSFVSSKMETEKEKDR